MNKQTTNNLHTLLLFASTGAIAWAIRGTAGWGGVDGTVIPGLLWGILWYYLAHRQGIDARSIVLWLGLGIALGGELGYGQYTGWIRGDFSMGEGIRELHPAIGYLWFFLCGIGWAAPGGILLGWALSKKSTPGKWMVRITWLGVLLVLLFAWPVIDKLSPIFLKLNSNLIFPFSDEGIYLSTTDKHLSRTLYTNTQNLAVVIWWLVALFIAVWQRDKITVVTGVVLGLGFGVGFFQSGLWALGYAYAPGYIDWWKVWELNSGFNLGILYALLYLWWARKSAKTTLQENQKPQEIQTGDTHRERWNTILLALGGTILLYFVGFEYFFWTGLALSLFFLIAMCLTLAGGSDAQLIKEKRRRTIFLFSVYYYAFLLFHGGTERLGAVFELYDTSEALQYSWPVQRIMLFVPVAILLSVVVLFQMVKVWRLKQITKRKKFAGISNKVWLVDLLTTMGFIGVATIWPENISVFYALFLVLALFSLNRIRD